MIVNSSTLACQHQAYPMFSDLRAGRMINRMVSDQLSVTRWLDEQVHPNSLRDPPTRRAKPRFSKPDDVKKPSAPFHVTSGLDHHTRLSNNECKLSNLHLLSYQKLDVSSLTDLVSNAKNRSPLHIDLRTWHFILQTVDYIWPQAVYCWKPCFASSKALVVTTWSHSHLILRAMTIVAEGGG